MFILPSCTFWFIACQHNCPRECQWNTRFISTSKRLPQDHPFCHARGPAQQILETSRRALLLSYTALELAGPVNHLESKPIARLAAH